MDRRRFFAWSAVGAVLWVVSVTLLGYFLGAAFPWLGENIDYVTVAILAFTVVPLAWEWLRHRQDRDEDRGHDPVDPIEPVERPAADGSV